MIVYIDILAAALVLAYLWLVGGRDRRCFIIGACAAICYLTVGCSKGLYGLAVLNVITFGLHIRNYKVWGKQ